MNKENNKMVEGFKCEKCGGINIMSPVKVEHEYEDNSDDEYPQWVVESVKIGGAQVTAHVCLDCGRVAFSVDPTPLKLRLKHESDLLKAEQAKQKEEERIFAEYSKLAYEYKELEKKNKVLVDEEHNRWRSERQKELTELNANLQINQSKISETRSKLALLLQEQQKKQRTLKELGLSPETNPEIVKKLVDEYESLNDLIKQLEIEKHELDSKLYEINRRQFSQSDEVSRSVIELDAINAKMRTLSSKHPFVLKKR